MRCNKAIKYMGMRFGKDLSSSHVQALEEHLKACTRCREHAALEHKISAMLRPEQQPEFPGWLHHQILSQAAAHDTKRHSYQQRWRLALVPAMMALILSLSVGVMLGKAAYNTANPYPSLSAEIAQNQDEGTALASFGEGVLSDLESVSGEEQ